MLQQQTNSTKQKKKIPHVNIHASRLVMLLAFLLFCFILQSCSVLFSNLCVPKHPDENLLKSIKIVSLNITWCLCAFWNLLFEASVSVQTMFFHVFWCFLGPADRKKITHFLYLSLCSSVSKQVVINKKYSYWIVSVGKEFNIFIKCFALLILRL